MILVTLGTQKQQFTRLLNYIEDANIEDEIIVQSGHTKYSSNKMKIFDFIDYDKMKDYVDKADIIITHGGTGSIIGPLKQGKKVIACARDKKYGEHVDNHQYELVNIFYDEGYILKVDEEIKLKDVIKNISRFIPKPYISNTKKFIEKLREEIN
ncbi:MAG: glycosyltransferase [Clostridia bacterium]|nr:glycosyltransferase [Clostridia bacterium]